MSTESLSREADVEQARMWDGAYDPSALGDQTSLWGDPPVPYASTAAELFAAAGQPSCWICLAGTAGTCHR